jgi:predicted Rossmann-fold nucleotide-binding protein
VSPPVEQGPTFSCPTVAVAKNIRYAGAYLGVDNVVPAMAMAQDYHCAEQIKQQRYPNGLMTLYGSSRINEDPAADKAKAGYTPSDNDKLYQQVRQFAYEWSKRYGRDYPVMSGAGPGLMLATGRGVMQAVAEQPGLLSVGYTTYYDRPSAGKPCATSLSKKYCGDATQALVKFGEQEVVTDGLIFTSVAARESLMIRHSAGIVIAPGGTGTEWEIFQIIESIKSAQLFEVPVYLLGDKQLHWQSFYDRVADMERRGTIRKGELTPYFKHAPMGTDWLDSLKREVDLARAKQVQ